MKPQSRLLRFAKWTFVMCGLWLIGLGGYFMFVRPPLLPEDLRFLGSSAIQVAADLPQLSFWLRNVFIVLGGFIAGCGVLIVFMSVHAVSRSLPGTGVALGFAGLLTVATMSGINFALDSDFKWLLLAPVAAWLFGLLCYWVGTRAEAAIITVGRINEASTK